MPTLLSVACSAPGCPYDVAPGTDGLLCLAHWEQVPSALRHQLTDESIGLKGPGKSRRWIELARAAVVSVGGGAWNLVG